MSTSSCPTPTVSISTISLPAASSTRAASPVACASPPRLPRVAMLRMKTPASAACDCMRTRSPRMAPPLNGLVGSTATTPTVCSRRRISTISRSTSVLLPAPGAPVMPIRYACPRPGEDLADELGAFGRLVLDQADRARDRARIALQYAIGERRSDVARRTCHWLSSCRAMTRRWISLVPSPIVSSLTSRKYFSAG